MSADVPAKSAKRRNPRKLVAPTAPGASSVPPDRPENVAHRESDQVVDPDQAMIAEAAGPSSQPDDPHEALARPAPVATAEEVRPADEPSDEAAPVQADAAPDVPARAAAADPPERDVAEPPVAGRNGRMSPRAVRSALIGGAVAAVLLLVALAALLGGGDDASAPAAPAPPKYGPTRLDVAAVKDQQKVLGRPVYWAGKPTAKQTLEFTVGADGSNTLRYLTGRQADAGGARAVAMYPLPTAYEAAQDAARRAGAMSKNTKAGLVVGKTSNAYNGYLAVKGLHYLIEVFDPQPGRAWELLTDGKIVPVPR